MGGTGRGLRAIVGGVFWLGGDAGFGGSRGGGTDGVSGMVTGELVMRSLWRCLLSRLSTCLLNDPLDLSKVRWRVELVGVESRMGGRIAGAGIRRSLSLRTGLGVLALVLLL